MEVVVKATRPYFSKNVENRFVLFHLQLSQDWFQKCWPFQHRAASKGQEKILGCLLISKVWNKLIWWIQNIYKPSLWNWRARSKYVEILKLRNRAADISPPQDSPQQEWQRYSRAEPSIRNGLASVLPSRNRWRELEPEALSCRSSSQNSAGGWRRRRIQSTQSRVESRWKGCWEGALIERWFQRVHRGNISV